MPHAPHAQHAVHATCGPHAHMYCPLRYPKAVHHGLVVAREAGLDTPSDLTPSHLPLLAHMRRVAAQWMSGVGGGDLRHQLASHELKPSWCLELAFDRC